MTIAQASKPGVILTGPEVFVVGGARAEVQRGIFMARKSQQTFAKRRRELKRAEKAAQKRARRAERKDPDYVPPEESIPFGDADTAIPTGDADTPISTRDADTPIPTRDADTPIPTRDADSPPEAGSAHPGR
ncbi:MAG: hypothetical protein IH888_09000 [Planctomycetes bacterium]|nr:hypothetical protein [Planctomycetota bacterium]